MNVLFSTRLAVLPETSPEQKLEMLIFYEFGVPRLQNSSQDLRGGGLAGHAAVWGDRLTV